MTKETLEGLSNARDAPPRAWLFVRCNVGAQKRTNLYSLVIMARATREEGGAVGLSVYPLSAQGRRRALPQGQTPPASRLAV